MFLSDFSPTDKNTFLGLAKKLIGVDDVLAPEELEMLGNVAAEMGLDAEADVPDGSIEELCAGVSSPQAQAFMLLELASLACVDNEYVDEERELLRTIASSWEIDPITIIRIEAWGKMRIELSREAAEVVHEVTSPLGRS